MTDCETSGHTAGGAKPLLLDREEIGQLISAIEKLKILNPHPTYSPSDVAHNTYLTMVANALQKRESLSQTTFAELVGDPFKRLQDHLFFKETELSELTDLINSLNGNGDENASIHAQVAAIGANFFEAKMYKIAGSDGAPYLPTNDRTLIADGKSHFLEALKKLKIPKPMDDTPQSLKNSIYNGYISALILELRNKNIDQKTFADAQEVASSLVHGHMKRNFNPEAAEKEVFDQSIKAAQHKTAKLLSRYFEDLHASAGAARVNPPSTEVKAEDITRDLLYLNILEKKAIISLN